MAVLNVLHNGQIRVTKRAVPVVRGFAAIAAIGSGIHQAGVSPRSAPWHLHVHFLVFRIPGPTRHPQEEHTVEAAATFVLDFTAGFS
jgi:hypothetical protein